METHSASRRYMSEETLRAEQSQREGHADGQWPVVSPDTARPLWPSPSYPALRGNVLPRFLSLSGAPPFPAPAHGETFPTLAETHAYLRAVAQPVRSHIRCGVEVLGAWELPPVRNEQGLARPGGWAVRSRDWSEQGAGRATTQTWDAVSARLQASVYVKLVTYICFIITDRSGNRMVSWTQGSTCA